MRFGETLSPVKVTYHVVGSLGRLQGVTKRRRGARRTPPSGAGGAIQIFAEMARLLLLGLGASQFQLHCLACQPDRCRAQAKAPCFRLATGPRSAPPAAESRGHSPPHQRRARQGRQHSQGESQAKPRSVRRRFGGCRRRCRRGVPGHGAWRARCFKHEVPSVNSQASTKHTHHV